MPIPSTYYYLSFIKDRYKNLNEQFFMEQNKVVKRFVFGKYFVENFQGTNM